MSCRHSGTPPSSSYRSCLAFYVITNIASSNPSVIIWSRRVFLGSIFPESTRSNLPRATAVTAAMVREPGELRVSDQKCSDYRRPYVLQVEVDPQVPALLAR